MVVYPEGSAIARELGHRTTLAVPLLRDSAPLGALVLRRAEVRPFTERQIELLKIFADQAVIAIENSRLFEAEQMRTKEVEAKSAELRESLEYQTATSEVLNVISRSPSQLQPVVDTIVQTAKRLCSAERATMWRWRERKFDLLAHTIIDPTLAKYLKDNPIPPDRTSLATRAVVEGRTMHVPDIQADPELGRKDQVVLGRIRTLLAVPLLRKGEPIGVLSLSKSEVKPFSDTQIAFVETFADQATIAIENTRLFEEVQARTRDLEDSLEHATATSEVLKVISTSAFDLRPVLESLIENAVRLCGADKGIIYRQDGDVYRAAVSYGHAPEWQTVIEQHPIAQDRSSATGRAVIDRGVVHIHDTLADPDYRWAEGHHAEQGMHRTILAVPMLREGVVIGVIVVCRTWVEPFAERQIGLVTTFADQAVIAIENTRLFEAEQASKRELQESLEHQTATSEVLQVISSSPGHLQPVYDTMLGKALQHCDARFGGLFRYEEGVFRGVSGIGVPEGLVYGVDQRAVDPATNSDLRNLVTNRQPIHSADLRQSASYLAGDPFIVGAVERGGARAALIVPMIKENSLIGVFAIYRQEVRSFTDKQIQLLENFAGQAVIAIENTRLFEEVQARTRELAKTVEDLEIASQHKNQFVANMSHELRTPLAAILGYAELIQEGFYEPQGPKSLDALTRIRSNGKHLLGLINTVLDIAKIESGQFTLNMTEYAIESVVETVRAATESLAQNKKLALTTSVDKSLPVGLGDEQRLTQVLLNLVGNAIKFTDTGEVSITAGARNGHFAVSVTDTGPGIPLDQQDRIFDQFHQVDSSLTKAKGGTGLGLAIAKQIVEMHGGRIWVVSTPGKGSTFQMELPTRAEFRKLALPSG
jgi:signal transduction histidine kinase